MRSRAAERCSASRRYQRACRTLPRKRYGRRSFARASDRAHPDLRRGRYVTFALAPRPRDQSGSLWRQTASEFAWIVFLDRHADIAIASACLAGGARVAKSAYHGRRGRLSLVARCAKAFDFRFDHSAISNAGGTMSRRQARDERPKPLAAFFVKPLELRNRLGMIIDAKIERRIV